MGRRQYNSTADRNLRERWQRIQNRRIDSWDVETPRDMRRRIKKTLYKTDQINIERLVPNEVAVLCTSPKQVRQLYWAIEKWKPEYTVWRSVDSLEDSFYFCDGATVAIITEDYPFFDETVIKIESRQYFEGREFEIIDFYELFPVVDLGEVRRSQETVDFLLGI